MVCHAAVVIGLLMIGIGHFQDRSVGMAMGTLYLLVPYTAHRIGQLHHVWPTAFLVWAICLYRRPVAAGWLLGLAAGTSLFPAPLFPAVVRLHFRRGAGRFALAFTFGGCQPRCDGYGVVAGWPGQFRPGRGALPSRLAAMASPQHREHLDGVHWAYRLPIFVLFVAFLAGVAVWPSPKNLSHLIALSAAVLIGVQFWHADQGGLYVLWYLPLILLWSSGPI